MAETAPKTPRLMRILLVASLALNLCVIGAAVGLAFGGSNGRMERFDLTVGPLTRALDAERRDNLRTELRNSGAFGQSGRQDMRRDLMTLMEVLRASEFDETTFRDVLARQRARLSSAQTAVVDALTREIAGMSPQERAAFADQLHDQFRRGARSGRGDN